MATPYEFGVRINASSYSSVLATTDDTVQECMDKLNALSGVPGATWTVGTDDTTAGTISIYGGGSGADGGVIKLYLGADDDTTIQYYAMQVVEDDLHIGPDTDTDKIVLLADGNLKFTSASQFVTIGGTSSGYGSLEVATTFASASNYGLYVHPTLSGTATGTVQIVGVVSNPTVTIAPAGQAVYVYGFATSITPALSYNTLYGANITLNNATNAITWTTATGVNMLVATYDAGAIITTAKGVAVTVTNQGTMGNAYCFYGEVTAGGTFSTQKWGIYITGEGANQLSAPLYLGVNDDTLGNLTLYGGGTGEEGGIIHLYLGADDDTTISDYSISIIADDLLIGPSTDTDLITLTAEGSLQITPTQPVTAATTRITYDFSPVYNGTVLDNSGLGYTTLNLTPSEFSATSTGTAGVNYTGIYMYPNPTGANLGTLYGINMDISPSTSSQETDGVIGIYFQSLATNGTSIGSMYGMLMTVGALIPCTTFVGFNLSCALSVDCGSSPYGQATFMQLADVSYTNRIYGQHIVYIGAPDTGNTLTEGSAFSATTSGWSNAGTVATFKFYEAAYGSGTTEAITTSYLYYGDATSASAVTHNWGIYLTGVTKNYLAGTLEVVGNLTTDANIYAVDAFVGSDDSEPGSLTLYGGGTGEDGGELYLYLGADDDTTIANFSIKVVEDDLLIGPNTDTDALKLDAAKDLYVTAGSIIMAASEYLNFGGTQGDSGYGIFDNAGTMQYKNSGGSWVNLGINNPITLGTDDTTAGYITLYGGGAEATGGYVDFYVPADLDATNQNFRIGTLASTDSYSGGTALDFGIPGGAYCNMLSIRPEALSIQVRCPVVAGNAGSFVVSNMQIIQSGSDLIDVSMWMNNFGGTFTESSGIDTIVYYGIQVNPDFSGLTSLTAGSEFWGVAVNPTMFADITTYKLFSSTVTIPAGASDYIYGLLFTIADASTSTEVYGSKFVYTGTGTSSAVYGYYSSITLSSATAVSTVIGVSGTTVTGNIDTTAVYGEQISVTTAAGAAKTDADVRGIDMALQSPGAGGTVSSYQGIYVAHNCAAGTATTIYGINYELSTSGATANTNTYGYKLILESGDIDVTGMYGIQIVETCPVGTGHTITTYNGVGVALTTSAAGTITTYKGVTSTITNVLATLGTSYLYYGLVTPTSGTLSNNWGIYLGGSAKNYLAGTLQTTSHLTIGDNTNGQDYYILFDGNAEDGTLTWMEDEGYFTITGELRATASNYSRYYHIPITSLNPGASGATFTAPTSNHVGGWQVDSASEILYGVVDVHSDWDAASDLTMEITFCTNADNSGGAAEDTVDLKAVFYYKGVGETACKTQTVEVPVTIGQAAQYKQFKAVFTINYDETDNVVEVGDRIGFSLNLETDTSEVDNIIIHGCSYHYHTTHVGIEVADT